jgi:DNA-binding CsgD family transcriptional regulator
MSGDFPAILERDAELAAAAAAIAAATAGRGTVVLAEGPAGIGKTTLLRAACSAVSGARVLTARGLALERDFPFGIVRQLFDPVRFSAPAEWGLLLDGAAALAGRVFDGGDPGVVEDDVPYATMHGLYWLAANLAAARPLIIVVDDAHWSDAASLRWLFHLAARIDGLPVALLLAARTGPDQPAMLEEIRSLPSGARLELAPLGAAATAAMVSARLGGQADEALCRSCHAATGGNPFFLESLTARLRGAPGPVEAIGPQSIAASVLRRVDQLGDGAVALTRALAVLGGPAALRPAAALAGLPTAEAALAADKLRAASVLGPGSTLEFAHPIMRTAVYESLPAGERAVVHGRAALLLEQDGGDPERVCLHLLRTEPAGDPHAVAVLRAAAAAASGRGAPESAAEYLRRALDEPPNQADRAELYLELGMALAAVRQPEAVWALREAVARSADSTAALVTARVLGTWACHDVAAEICRDALAAGSGQRSPAALDLATADRLEAEFFANAWIVPATADEAWTLAGDRLASSDQPNWQVLGALAATFAGQPPGAAMARIGPALASGLAGIPPDSVTALCAMLTLVWNDQLDLALSLCDMVLAEARSRGSMSTIVHVSQVRSMVDRRLGRLEDAAADALPTDEFKLATAPPSAMAWMGTFCLEALTRLGRLDEAEAFAATVAARQPPDGWIHTNMFREARAELRVAQQRYPEALDDLRAAADGWRALRIESPAVATLRTIAVTAHLAIGNHEEAASLAREQLALARATGTPLALGSALRAYAAVADDPVQPLEEAITLFQSVGANYDLALALADLGACLRRAGRVAQARDPLRRALDLAERSGAVPLRDYARRELAAAGVRPRRTALTGPDALTSAERQVAGLAAAGRSNKQIAQHLFISTGTVETHLRHIFQKLDIASRADIPVTLASAIPTS